MESGMTEVKPRDNRWYGYRRGHRDINDHPFRPKVSRVPVFVDLRAHCPPVMDQGALGSCTAHGITGILRFNMITRKIDHQLSRLQLYYDERVIEGSVSEDAGAEIRDGIKSAVKRGVGQEKYWPYVIEKFADKPSRSVYRSAVSFEALEYETVEVSPLGVKQALASFFPVVIGFDVYESFESAAVARTGIVPMPKRGEALLGGHCVYLTGYGQKAGYFTARNSWGIDWGDSGDFYMPEAMINPNYAADFWVVRETGHSP
jgi:C1A family cysteine protease